MITLDTTITEYAKSLRSWSNTTKAKLLNSRVEDLIQNKDSHKFWTYLKSLKEKEPSHSNKHDVPAETLFEHFQRLHSGPDLSSSSSDLTSLKEDISSLDKNEGFL